MRLFTAIVLPDAVRKELVSIQPRHPAIRLTPESQIHMTLRFIGETDKSYTRRVTQVLSRVGFQPFEITLQGTGSFPKPSSPYILWAGVRYHPLLTELYEAMREELLTAGVPRENHSFHPHVTLGRIRKKKQEISEKENPSLQEVLDHYFHGKPSQFCTTFLVDRFRLYQSRLHSGGAIHYCLNEYMAL